jgi:hypothetical protein
MVTATLKRFARPGTSHIFQSVSGKRFPPSLSPAQLFANSLLVYSPNTFRIPDLGTLQGDSTPSVAGDGTDISSQIATWQDQTKNGYDFIQPVSMSQPKLIANSLNGRSTVYFDAIDDSIGCSTSIPTTGGEFTMISLTEISDIGGDQFSAPLFNGNGINGYGFYYYSNALRSLLYGDVAWLTDPSPDYAVPGNFELWSAVRTGGVTSFYVNGSQKSLDNSTAAFIPPTGGMVCSFTSFNGRLGTQLIWDHAISDGDRTAVEGLILSYYGL